MLCGATDFVAASRHWRERLGGSLHNFAPAWIDAQAQLRKCTEEGFGYRFNKLKDVVGALSDDVAVKRVLRFEPAEPQSCLVHGCLHGNREELEAAHERVQQATGFKLWNTLRGRGYQISPMVNGTPLCQMYFG